jgi:hypothetical protein
VAKALLHEILAVEAGLKKNAGTVLEEAKDTFSKRTEHFTGHIRTYECKKEDDPTKAEEAVVDRKEIVTTVDAKLRYMFDHVIKHVDAMATKDSTNQLAKADIVVDGTTIASGVPVTTLLALEDEVKAWRDVMLQIPTLQPGKSWKPAMDLGPNLFKQEFPEVKTRTAKSIRNHVKYEATKEHPAQVEMISVDEIIGLYKSDNISGAITPAAKSDLLNRVDNLHRAVKQARQRANSQEVTQVQLGKALVGYLLTQ